MLLLARSLLGMTTTDSLTLTVYEVARSSRPGHPDPRPMTFSERAGAEKYADADRPVVEVQHTYRVGQAVTVDAFGRLRQGVVTKLGRTRVTVRFASNQEGTNIHEKAFPAYDVRPLD